MTLYLHGYIPKTEDLDEGVFCAHVDKWEIQKVELPVPSHRLVTTSSRNALGTEMYGKSFSHAFSLVPGAMFWLVDNDPKEVQPPNGSIVWRWPEREEKT